MSTTELDRSMLDGKDREELHAIAGAVGVKAPTRMRKADLVERDPRGHGGHRRRRRPRPRRHRPRPGRARCARPGRRRPGPRRSRPSPPRRTRSRPPVRPSPRSRPDPAGPRRAARPRRAGAVPRSRRRDPRRRRPDRQRRGAEHPERAERSERVEREAVPPRRRPAATAPRSCRSSTTTTIATRSATATSRRRRRGRGRNRPGAEGEVRPGVEPSGEPIEVQGLLELRDEGYGFLRTTGYLAGRERRLRVGVAGAPVRAAQGRLRRGLVAAAGEQREVPGAAAGRRPINDLTPDDARQRPRFEDLTPLFPDEKLRLELLDNPREITGRIVDLLAPIGKGQRGLDRVAAQGRQDHHPQADRRTRSSATTPRCTSWCCSSTSGPKRSPTCAATC